MAGTAKTRGDKKRRAARKRGAFCAGTAALVMWALTGCAADVGQSAGTELEIRSEPNAGAGAESPTALAAAPREELAESRVQEELQASGLPQCTVTVEVDGETVAIPCASGGSTWVTGDEDGNSGTMVACGAEPVSSIIESAESLEELPYVPLGSCLQVVFSEGSVPDRVTLEDYILNENGGMRYGEQATDTRELAPADGAAPGVWEIEVNGHMAALLSSSLKDYEKGAVLRGLTLDCTWENGSQAEWGMVIRTDAQVR